MSKYLGGQAAKCVHCRKPLKPSELVLNRHHLYEIGILYICPCQKTRIWTNSIRRSLGGHQELFKKT